MSDNVVYSEYINSPAWRSRRDRALHLAGYRCQYVTLDPTEHDPCTRCTSTINLSVHHTTYFRLGAELDIDLIVLCWFHHMVEHLMQVNCCVCGYPLLVWYDRAEVWLELEMVSLGVDVWNSKINWSQLPTKNQLIAVLRDKIERCPFCVYSMSNDSN